MEYIKHLKNHSISYIAMIVLPFFFGFIGLEEILDIFLSFLFTYASYQFYIALRGEKSIPKLDKVFFAIIAVVLLVKYRFFDEVFNYYLWNFGLCTMISLFMWQSTLIKDLPEKLDSKVTTLSIITGVVMAIAALEEQTAYFALAFFVGIVLMTRFKIEKGNVITNFYRNVALSVLGTLIFWVILFSQFIEPTKIMSIL